MPLAALGGILAGAAGTSAAATAGAWTAIGAGTAAATGLIGASKQAGAAKDAAQTQADAAKQASADQLKANEEALAFQREQATYQAAQAERDRAANYAQWRAHQQKVGSIGQMLGLGGVAIPDYVPGITPNFATAPAGAPGAPVPVGAGQTPAAAAARLGAVMPVRVPANFGAAVTGTAGTLPLANSAPPLASPFTSDWTPRDPRTGQPIALPPSVNPYASFGAYLGAA